MVFGAIDPRIGQTVKVSEQALRGGGIGAYYNHQTWEKGRNAVRYVPRDRSGQLQKAITGYQQYLKLTKTYADESLRRTRPIQTAKTRPAVRTKTSQIPAELTN